MTMPNFLIIGAARSGTTSLYHYLRQHPQVFMSPVKEPRFFAFEGMPPNYGGPGDDRLENRAAVTHLDEYQALFRGVAGETAIGEASTLYLSHPGAAERIRRHLPDARLIAILRHPADRAYSSYLLMVRDGREPLRDFARALDEEETRLSRHWSHMWAYRDRGFYGVQLTRYLERFARDHLRVCLYDDFRADPLAVLRDIFSFLGVDESFVPETSVRHNPSGVPRSRMLYDLGVRLGPIRSALEPLLRLSG